MLAQQVEPAGLLVQPRQQLANVGGGGGAGQVGGDLVERAALAVKRLLVAQKDQRAFAHALLLLRQLLGHALDAWQVGIAQLAQRVQAALALAQAVQRAHEVGRRAPHVRGQLAQQLALGALGPVEGARGVGADGFDLLEFGQRGARALLDGGQVGRGLLRLGRVEPEVGVARALALADEVVVRGARGRLLAQRAGDAHQVGHAAHQVGIAHAAEKARARRLRGGVFVVRERRLPQLHGVHARGLARRGLEHQDAPVGKARVTVGQDGRGQRLVDQVVGEQGVDAAVGRAAARRAGRGGQRTVEDVGHVFAVGRADHALEAQHGGQLGRQIKALVLARLQVVAAGKNDAVVFGQLHARGADGVDAGDIARALVEHQKALRRLAVGLDAQQNQPAQPGVGDLGIAQGLVGVFDRLVVDAETRVGVVLDLDGQVAPGGFDEHGVENVDVRVAPAHVLLARDGGPFKVVAGRQGHVALAAVVHIDRRAIALQPPAKHADVAALRADLKGRQQPVGRDAQRLQGRLLVIGVQLAEIGLEAIVVEKTVGQGQRHQFVGGRRCVVLGRLVVVHQLVQREHVAHAGLAPQTQKDVEAQQHAIGADAHHVARHAGVLGARAGAQQQVLLLLAEGLQPRRVQRLRLGQERIALRLQALLQQFVAAAGGDGGVDGGRFVAGRRCGRIGGFCHGL